MGKRVMRLSFIAVTSDQQFRDLLIVRNECRDGLTHDKHEITLGEQTAWKAQCWPGDRYYNEGPLNQGWMHKTSWYEPYLLYNDQTPVGYGLLKWDSEKYWMTVGVARDFRRKGLGKLITNLITEIGHRGNKEVWLDVMDDNPMLPTYIKSGYEFQETTYGEQDLH